jgi:tetratricopeptide (TPR) repeat protein
MRQGRQLMKEGKLQDALQVYQNALKSSPRSVPANVAAGEVLDLMGRGEEARTYFAKAVAAADTRQQKSYANRSMAMSYAFQDDCGKSVEYEKKVFDQYGAEKNFFQQGEIADEAARVCLDSGNLEEAYRWYKIGHDTGLKEPGITPARRDLWNFRWEHALARIAARRGHRTEAEKHAAAAKAILDKGTNPQQAPFFPYLQGYVAFYTGDYKSALADLSRANQNDPFIQCMLAGTYEKLGDKEKAAEYYRKAAAATSHNPAAAYAVPLAKRKLA